MDKNIFKNKQKAIEIAKCYDCGKDINIKEREIENGVLLMYEDDSQELFVMKCDKCYKKNPGIENYKECEVYSRIVGYLRPVQNYNPGKKQEYTERKEYKVSPE